MLLNRTGHRLQRLGTLLTTTSEHRTPRLGVLAPERRGGRLPRQPLGACARLDLLGFELCSPEVLLDLQDLDHELPPTTRELVQALGITVDEDDEAACDGSSAPTTIIWEVLSRRFT